MRDWRDYAACVTEIPELFFPLGWTGDTNAAQIAEARAVCARCPVVADCLDDGLSRNDQHAILASTTPSQRERIKRRTRTAS